MAEEEITSMSARSPLILKRWKTRPPSRKKRLPGDSPGQIHQEKSVTCLECGKTFKIITRKHLAMHGLDADTYREKWGIKKNTPLVCKELQRERRKKMKEMKLWEKRRAANDQRKKA